MLSFISSLLGNHTNQPSTEFAAQTAVIPGNSHCSMILPNNQLTAVRKVIITIDENTPGYSS